MNKMTEEELVENGLMGESYDQITRIRTRIRKINDIEMPVRGGIAPEQFGVGLVVFFISAIVFALIVRPLFSLFGISPHWLVTVTLLFAPPLLAAQRVIKPMRYEKSIPSSMKSWWRYVTDENTHARGLPHPARPQQARGGPPHNKPPGWGSQKGRLEAVKNPPPPRGRGWAHPHLPARVGSRRGPVRS